MSYLIIIHVPLIGPNAASFANQREKEKSETGTFVKNMSFNLPNAVKSEPE